MLINFRGFVVLLFVIVISNEAHSIKYKICVVDGKGEYQKTKKHCLILQAPESKVECVVGLDRFDCLRKLRKGLADFSIFTPEDLIAASNTDNEILITTELRDSQKDEYRERLVAVVSDSSGITSKYEIKNSIFCHPGYDTNQFVSEILMNFLETTEARPQSCEVKLTVPENRILSSSRYFKSACKAGPWVNDRDVDRELKQKYSNLCKACKNANACSEEDLYYGLSGSLLCLRDGTGDISWTTYKQVHTQFRLSESNNTNNTEWTNYKFLCNDNTLMSLNSTKPCIWVAQPWPVVAANKQHAAEIQKIVSEVDHTLDWKGALLDLLEVVTYHIEVFTLSTTDSVDTYLSNIPGFISANSFTNCHPPRTVRICTTSISAQYKCGWMREAATVHGVEPDIDCLKGDNETHCMDAIQKQMVDVVITHPDYLNIGEKRYNMKPLFYETVEDNAKYLTIAVVDKFSKINTFEDLRGKRACFPSYDGVAWNTVIHKLSSKDLLSGCPHEEAMANFFGDSCVPNIPQEYSNKLEKNCQNNDFRGDNGALNCLKLGLGDVAFVSHNNLQEFILDKNNAKCEFRKLCDEEPCHLSWSAAGQAMVSRNITTWREKDILDVFLELDSLYGRQFKEQTRMFTMYGEFNGQRNILFHDNTMKLQKTPKWKNYDNMPREYGKILKNTKTCQEHSTSMKNVPSILVLLISIMIYFYSR